MSEDPVVQLELRPMLPSDRNLVTNSWVKSYASKSRDAREYEGAAKGSFADDYYPIVNDLLARSVVTVACLKMDPDAVVGWMAFEGETLHYVLVKPRWRRLRIASWMLASHADKPVVFTHRTSVALLCPIPKGWAYRRFKIWPSKAAPENEHGIEEDHAA